MISCWPTNCLYYERQSFNDDTAFVTALLPGLLMSQLALLIRERDALTRTFGLNRSKQRRARLTATSALSRFSYVGPGARATVPFISEKRWLLPPSLFLSFLFPPNQIKFSLTRQELSSPPSRQRVNRGTRIETARYLRSGNRGLPDENFGSARAGKCGI